MKSKITFLSRIFCFFLLLVVSKNVNAQYSGAGTFTQISDIADLTDGYYVITDLSSSKAMSNVYAGTFLATATVAPSAGIVTNPDASIVWRIETNGSGRTMYNEAVASYTSYTGSSNNIQMVGAVTTDNQRWIITNSVSTFTISNAALTTRKLQYNASSPRFACYTGTQQNLAIYKMGAAPVGPEINLQLGGTNYANNSTYNFGSQLLGGTYTVVVAIQNTGTSTLTVSNGNTTNNIEFDVTNGPLTPFTIAPSSVQTFTMVFTPTVAGTFTNILSIFNDDADESTYTVTYTGVGVAPSPEINLQLGGTNYANYSTYNFGSQLLGGTYTVVVAIQNTGTSSLTVSNGNTTNNIEFDVTNGPLTPFTIAPSSVQTFTMVFTPTVAGTYTNILSIFNDDADESTYTVTFTGVGVAALAPEINIVQNATSYTTGSTFSFNAEQNWFSEVMFTIENTGTGALTISTYSITGAEYSLVGTMPTSIAAGSSANFTIRFAPIAIGTFTGSITINNNDANEGSYVINLNGTSTAATPAIFTETFGVGTGTTAIPSYGGWSSPSLTFTGSGDIRSTTASNYFGATAQGNAFLTNTVGKDIEISNINTSTCSSFTLSFGVYKSATTADGSSLAVEVSTDGVTYTALTFPLLPSGAGTVGWYYRTASGTIPSTSNLRIRFTNTTTESQFRIDDVKLKGVCAPAPEINIVRGATNYLTGSTYNLATVNTGSTNVITFTVQNLGTSPLNITSATFTGGAEYTLLSDPIPAVIAPSGVFTITFVYSPTVVGTYTETLTLYNNDADENPYVLNIKSVVTTLLPEINIKQGATTYTTGSTYNFVNTTIATSTTVVFTIQNTGTGALNITSNTPSGALFTINASFPSSLTIAAGSTATFSVTFAPTAVGTYSGSITFANNDADESTYVLNYSGVAQNAPEPEINIVTTALDFGSIEENTTADLTYVVQNTGTANLTLTTATTAPYSLVGTNATTISAGNSATYTVRFSPTATGTFTANVTITSNDADEPSLTVTLTGIATVGSPVVFTETFGSPSGTTSISSYSGWSNSTLTFVGSGDVRTSSPSTSYSGASGSGNVFLTNGGTKNIIISNINTSACTSLSLSFGVLKSVSTYTGSELLVEVSADGTTYTALTFPALPAGTSWNYVNASGVIPQAANLRIRFTNTSTTGQFRIDDVKLKGSCGASAPEINVKQATTSIASGGSYDFGVVTTGSKSVVFTIENTGAAALAISSSTFTGAQFSLVGAMPTSVAAGSSANFTVQFTSSTMGSYSGSVTLVNTDADEASYVINFTASVPTSIEKTSLDNAINMFPNPNNGTTLNFNKTVNATIYNAIGAKVIEVKNSDSVDVSALENGIYMVNINNKTKRLIIAK